MPYLDLCHDPLLAGNCSSSLPEGWDHVRPLFDEAVGRHYRLVHDRYVGFQEAYTLLVAPALLELQDFARRQASGAENRTLALWATHDTTIIPLLVALGAWDGVWPQYSESLVLEVYRASEASGGRAFVRLLRRGKPVTIPSCGSSGPLGLCDLEQFLPGNIVALRDPAVWESACALDKSQLAGASVTPAAEHLESKSQVVPDILAGAAWSPLAFISVLCCAGVLMGYSAGTWRARRSVSSAGVAAPLLQA